MRTLLLTLIALSSPAIAAPGITPDPARADAPAAQAPPALDASPSAFPAASPEPAPASAAAVDGGPSVERWAAVAGVTLLVMALEAPFLGGWCAQSGRAFLPTLAEAAMITVLTAVPQLYPGMDSRTERGIVLGALGVTVAAAGGALLGSLAFHDTQRAWNGAGAAGLTALAIYGLGTLLRELTYGRWEGMIASVGQVVIGGALIGITSTIAYQSAGGVPAPGP